MLSEEDWSEGKENKEGLEWWNAIENNYVVSVVKSQANTSQSSNNKQINKPEKNTCMASKTDCNNCDPTHNTVGPQHGLHLHHTLKCSKPCSPLPNCKLSHIHVHFMFLLCLLAHLLYTSKYSYPLLLSQSPLQQLSSIAAILQRSHGGPEKTC